MSIIYNTTSTGTSDVRYFDAPVTRVAAQASGDATYAVEGSLNGVTWTDLLASSTAAAGAIRASTGAFLVTQARVVLSAVGSTSFVVNLIGA